MFYMGQKNTFKNYLAKKPQITYSFMKIKGILTFDPVT